MRVLKQFLPIGYGAFVILTSVLLITDLDKPTYFSNLWILPLVFGMYVELLMLAFPDRLNNLCLLGIIGIFSVRNILAPFFLFWGNYLCYFKIAEKQHVDKAIVLMLLESLIMVGYSFFKSRFNQLNKSDNSQIVLHKNTMITVMCIVLLLIFIVARFARPEFYSGFRTIFSSDEIRTKVFSDEANGPFFTLFMIFFPIFYLMGCVSIMTYINRIYHGIVRLLLNLLLISVPLFFMDGGDAFTIMFIMSLAITSLKIGGIRSKTFAIFISLVLLLIIFYIFIMIAGDRGGLLNSLSILFQSYFPGVSNFAGVFNMNEHEKINLLFYDIYYTIPFRNTLFGVPGDNRLVIMYTIDNNALWQIIPCAGQLFYYFGIFGVFFECMFIKGAFHNYRKCVEVTDIYSFFTRTLLTIYLILTPVMYNFTIFMSNFFGRFIWLLLINYVFRIKTKKGYIYENGIYGYQNINAKI